MEFLAQIRNFVSVLKRFQLSPEYRRIFDFAIPTLTNRVCNRLCVSLCALQTSLSDIELIRQ